MQNASVTIEPVSDANAEAAVRFLVNWAGDAEAGARTHLAEHGGTGGASLLAVRDGVAVGFVSVLWVPNYPGFAGRGIPLVHQVAVAGPARRAGIGARQRPLSQGTRVTMDHDVILWLTKDLGSAH